MNKYRSYLSDVCDRMNVLHHSFSPARTSSDHMVVLVHEAFESVPSEYQQLLLWETCMNLSILKSLLQKIGCFVYGSKATIRILLRELQVRIRLAKKILQIHVTKTSYYT